MNRILLITLLSVLLAVSAAFAQKKNPVQAANAKAMGLVGKLAPEFNLPDLDQTFRLSDRRGEIVVLAFWATWCPPCRAEMPAFAKLQKEMAPQGVAVTLVAFDDPAKARDFLVKKKLDVASLMDEPGSVAALYGAHVLPRTFVIDRTGVVVKAFTDKASEAELRRAVDVARKSNP